MSDLFDMILHHISKMVSSFKISLVKANFFLFKTIYFIWS